MKFVSMKKVHGGKFLSRYDIVYETIDGGRKNYEMVSRSGDRTEFHQLHDHDPEAVIMIMHDPSGEKILINREFRLAMGEFIYNFPAGLVDEGEDWDTSAARELREETGLDLGDAEPELLGETRTQTRAFVDTYAVRLPFALADVRLQEGETIDARLASFDEVERAILEGAPWLVSTIRERMLPLLPKLRAFRDRR